MNRIGRRTFLLATSALAIVRPAAADEVDDALRDVAKARAKIDTMVATFTQERVLSLMATTVTSTGEMTIVRPDRMRWELRPPDEAIYWVTPDGIAYRTPNGSGKVAPGSAGPLGSVLDDLLVALGGDLTGLRKRNDVRVEKLDGGALRLVMKPRSPNVAKLVKRVSVELASDLVAPRKVVLEESGDDRTTVTFDAPKLNAPVDPAKMKPH